MGERSGSGGQRELEREVLKRGACTGCGACVHLCPYQAIHQDRTVTLHACDLEAGSCYAFCPRTPTDLARLRGALHTGVPQRPGLGAIRGFYVVRSADPEIRRRAQHGGTVTQLVRLALREGLIDQAVLAERGEGLLPRSVTVSDPDQVAGCGGSRFVVSPTVAEFNRVSRGGPARIGVVVTPCQALALAKMRVAESPDERGGIGKLSLVIGLFCGWTLSWKRLAALLQARTELSLITGMDIPPSRHHTLELYTATGTVRVSLDEVNPCVREACHTCGDMTAEFSDLSVGSARLPEGWEVARGWNQVIVRSEHGMALMETARRRGLLEFREPPPESLERLVAAAVARRQRAAERQA